MEYVRYRHLVNSGDLVASLAGMKHVFETTGKKAIIMQQLNVAGHYYEGARHPLTHDGVQVTMTSKQWNMLTPLLLSQEYIEDCEVWEGQPFDIDLNRIREGEYSTMPWGQIQRWCWYADPALACDLSKPWLMVPKLKGFEGNIAINFTSRYRNAFISYFFMKPIQDRLLFFGTEEEHHTFCKQNKLVVKHHIVDNFYEMAVTINSCKFFIGCQSFAYNIVEATKLPRILEVCRTAPNCVPVGEHAYDVLHQGPMEFYVEQLINK